MRQAPSRGDAIGSFRITGDPPTVTDTGSLTPAVEIGPEPVGPASGTARTRQLQERGIPPCPRRDVRPFTEGRWRLHADRRGRGRGEQTRLEGDLESYPEAGVITGVEIAQDVGNVVQVDILHGPEQQSGTSCAPVELDNLRTAVCSALVSWRHTVRTIEIAP